MTFRTRHLGVDVDDWLESSSCQKRLDGVLHGTDDGELYVQATESEVFVLSDSKLKSASISSTQGFGLRTVCDELVGFSHANELTDKALTEAVNAVALAKIGQSGSYSVSPSHSSLALYRDLNPSEITSAQSKIEVLNALDIYARAKDPRVKQVQASISGASSSIHILRAGGECYSDVRPQVGLSVFVVMEQDGRMEFGQSGAGGRYSMEQLVTEESWRKLVDEAIRMASVNLTSVPAPAGKMTVVMESGWPGVLVHEAVGHGLEGDAVHKGHSIYAGQVGEQVAAKGVTIVDHGSIPERRGSLNIDDEGTPTQENVLIENGILKGFMHDRLSARLMGAQPTGNGRRESYAHTVMPRMTNTFMTNGVYERDEIVASVEDGVFATHLGGGQVNITNGDFVFECSEAYRIRGGKIEEPVKGATIIGNGPKAMKNVTMVGNDSRLDHGIGICGKEGQSVPVGVGQPMVRIENITVGGTG